WTASGAFVNERFGGISYYPGAVMDPDYENRYYIPIGWDDVALVELDNTTRAWTILKVFPNGASTEGRIATQLDDMVHAGLASHSAHWKIKKKNGLKYLIGEAGSGVSILRIDETNNVIVPVAVLSKYNPGTFSADPANAPDPWDAARVANGYSLTNHPEFFSWCDLNGNGQAETSEFLFTNSAVKMIGKFFLDENWNAYFAYYRSLQSAGTFLRRVNNTSGNSTFPVWNWATHTQLTTLAMPPDFTAAEIGEAAMLHLYKDPASQALYGTFTGRRDEKFGRYGNGFVNDDQGLVRLLKWNSAGSLLWQTGGHHPESGFNMGLPTPPGVFHQPVLILGKINGNLVVQDRLANPGQVWTDDGLYAGNLLDHRAADGLPDIVYKWFLDNAGNDALIQSDCMVGSINKTPGGDVYWMANGRQAPVVYKITGWDGWQTASGSIVVATTPASATFSGTGLQGEYFNNPSLAGSPAVTRTDASLWFDDALTGGHITALWGVNPPHAAITTADYSVRWTGFVEAPLGENFNLIVETETNSKVRLWIDGQLLVDSWKIGVTPVHGGVSHQRVRRLASKSFEAGRRYALRLEYARGTAPAEVHLYWESPTMERLHIPAKFLRATDPATDIVIDNSDAASLVAKTGTWQTSSASAGYYGANYNYANGASPATHTATYKPAFAAAGAYAVYAQWSAGVNRSAATSYTVNHAGGAATVLVNQQVNGGAWRYLGTFDFAAGKSGTVVVTNLGSGVVVADAVRFSRDHAAVVNAGQDAFVAWPTNTTTLTGSASDAIGSGSLSYTWSLLAGPGSASFTTPNAASTSVTVTAPGSYDFLLTASDGTTTSTDVVNVLFLDQLVVDNTDTAYVTKVGSWANGVSGTFYGANYLHDGNALKGTKSVTYRLPVPFTRTYTVYTQWSAGSGRGSAVPITINHAGGSTTVHVNQRLNGGTWVSLGNYKFNQGTANNVVISNNDPTGHVIADAIRLTP
ncbi:MAG: PA14 domain-containing protein, partial [Rariglobus sp.]